MSVPGHHQTSTRLTGRFGLPLRADIDDADGQVSYGPEGDMASYSITSSARPSSESGTVMPSALAVFELIISSIFVDRWTGRSPGLSPLRNSSGVCSDQPVVLVLVGSKTNQSTCRHENWILLHRRDRKAKCKLCKLLRLGCYRIHPEQRAARLLSNHLSIFRRLLQGRYPCLPVRSAGESPRSWPLAAIRAGKIR